MNLIPAYPAPDFKDIGKWSDGSMHSIMDFKGKAILLDFWTYTCIYCLRTIPTINKIKEKYNYFYIKRCRIFFSIDSIQNQDHNKNFL